MTADELFSLDLDGVKQPFRDLLADGLDRDYSARFPALRALTANGSPRDALFAATMLASWAQRDGYLAILRWADAPAKVPWAGAPEVRDRFTGVDSAFAMLAHAIETARPLRHTEAVALLRIAATRALLGIYHRVFFDRDLDMVVGRDDALATRCAPEIESAVELATAASKERHPFDMATQAAYLVGTLARLDDARGAAAAEALRALHPDHPRALRELALSLSSGRGRATLSVLERMVEQTTGGVRDEAEQAIERRRGKVVA